MIGYLKRWNARRLKDREDAKRYFYLRLQIDDVHKWCDGEARSVAQWLLEYDTDMWRALDVKPIGTLPSRIDGFRRWLYEQRALQKSTVSS